MTGAIEFVILFIYDGVIKPTLKNKANKFAPYLLTVFFFILVMNLLGLIVIFPGGANLTGNIAVTLVLAIITFLITNIFATKHYWKEIFNPDVPWWLKWPLPIMPIIEIFGVFTKPAALTVRLFANMMGGHMIVIVLTLLIFIFAAMGPVVTGATAVVSIIFSVFMLLIDVLVSFIQAYVFTMLSTLFIALGQEEGHHEDHKKEEDPHAPASRPPRAQKPTHNQKNQNNPLISRNYVSNDFSSYRRNPRHRRLHRCSNRSNWRRHRHRQDRWIRHGSYRTSARINRRHPQ